jgi:hydroxymethylglutaryl-CoA lyase
MKKNEIIKITESPRDAQQGLPYLIAPEKRAAYINALLKVGFDVIDFGSFVSPKAVPQMADQEKVLELVDKSGSKSKLMAIVGNLRGGFDAAAQKKVDIIGFPYSLSDTFLQKNINSSHEKALSTIDGLLKICSDHGKTLRIFMSLAYGNPYGDPWSIQLLAEHIEMLAVKGIRTVTLADTIGIASAELISEVYLSLFARFPDHEFGLHIHTRPNEWHQKLEAAWNAGCRWYEGVISGVGGCPMTGYELIGNLDTLNLIAFLEEKGTEHQLDKELLSGALLLTEEWHNNPEIKFYTLNGVN